MRVHYEKQGKELNAARMRMATLPEGPHATAFRPSQKTSSVWTHPQQWTNV